MKSKDTKHQKCKRGKHVTGQTHVTNSQAVVHERDLATAIPIIILLKPPPLLFGTGEYCQNINTTNFKIQ